MDALILKWSGMTGEEHIPLSQHGSAVALRALTRFTLGDYFKQDQSLFEFRRDFDIVSTSY